VALPTPVLGLLLGLLGGFASALLGIGGGIVMMPLLILAASLPANEAVATSIGIIVATSTGSAARYARRETVDLRLGTLIGAAELPSAILGAYTSMRIEERWLGFLFGIFLLCVSLYVGIHPERRPSHLTIRRQALVLLAAFLAAFLAALFGVGGGFIIVPILMAAGLPVHTAIATSVFSISLWTGPVALIYHSRGLVALSILPSAAVGALIGSGIGSRVALRLPAPILRRIFAIALAALALMVLHRYTPW